ncbi:MAG: KpsF/GutQ family sugar-phosphate isomerase [Tepidiphilus sp.]|jgi:arabinose-5-phosphate isomerase|uniref:KpsF/GutQ family protein n=1 Tax=Tepidiphilus thermophilus TaxID=876478 RepID=A0A0K6IPF6_9PROT|nr:MULTISPECIES: KpsF/GutQ family sugar-phosphate isomerase [Tepidiphilus]MBP6999356.1 KpsF/GutQ family sugar-phosphate isomerase [Tepidiphilus sp.]CUB04983.1 KpsF/GutQ family protein [Tepidiphilus thermophilus]
MDRPLDPGRILESARRTLRIESEAIAALAERLGPSFAEAVRLVLGARGRVIVTGVGKSGHIGRKIAATLASTGTPAYFVHAAEAAHGDLGMIAPDDVVIAISYSGASDEVLMILPAIKRQGAALIALTGRPDSPLARQSDVHLDVSVREEACPHNIAPTASTTAALAMGDALAIALLQARGFGPEDFARSHPGGALGRRLLTRVADVMRPRPEVPTAPPNVPLTEALLTMSRGGMGMVAVVDADDRPLGIFTDGDLRRTIEQGADLRSETLAQRMNPSPKTISPEALAAEAARRMEDARISQMLVVEDGRLVGALHMHDLMRAKVL